MEPKSPIEVAAEPMPTCGISSWVSDQADVGPVSVPSEKTRIALHVRMSFAAFMPRRDWLSGQRVLARRIDRPVSEKSRCTRREMCCARSGCILRSGLTPRFSSWLKEAYRVGEQRRLQTPS